MFTYTVAMQNEVRAKSAFFFSKAEKKNHSCNEPLVRLSFQKHDATDRDVLLNDNETICYKLGKVHV